MSVEPAAEPVEPASPFPEALRPMMTREEIRDELAERLKAEGNPDLLSIVVADIYATLAVSDLPDTTRSLRDIISQLGAFFGPGGGGGMVRRLMGKKGRGDDASS